ncbi:hypothetical protein G7Y89_g4019 [Cudoniella acicularis]|uniref:F-box domain-containing protein n=1 Tax=Cudoniella acicularis TaxID=354080 RepID=A0A8H4RR23_9HELO|nr:hypothetical protein G7Y89_g4019 [Cudoniella acicularis]
MPGLTSLPTEILLFLIRYLDQSSLASLAITSRQFHDLALAPLYAVISGTFSKRPDLAALVKNVHFSSRAGSHDDNCHFPGFHRTSRNVPWVLPYILSRSDRQRILSFLKDLQIKGTQFEEELTQEIHEGSLDAIMAIFLTRLPELEVLDIDFGLMYRSHLLGQMLCSLPVNPVRRADVSRLKCLKTVKFRNSIQSDMLALDWRPMSGDVQMALFSIPSLENIEMVLHESCEFAVLKNPKGHPDWLALSRLRILRLHNSPVSINSLCQIWNWGKWEDLSTALLSLKSSLRELIISVDSHGSGDEQRDRNDFNPGLFEQTWIRRGSLGSPKIRDILPARLEELCLRDDMVDCVHATYKYRWTPWYVNLESGEGDMGETGEELDMLFDENSDASQLMVQLRDLSTWKMEEGNNVALNKLVFKMLQGRVWTDKHAHELEDMSRAAGVTCVTHVRMNNWGDEVAETILWDPIFKQEGGFYKERLIWEPRRTFYQRCCEVSNENFLNEFCFEERIDEDCNPKSNPSFVCRGWFSWTSSPQGERKSGQILAELPCEILDFIPARIIILPAGGATTEAESQRLIFVIQTAEWCTFDLGVL